MLGLIVSADQCHAWVISQPFQLVDGFAFHIGLMGCITSDHAACEHEVLPNKKSCLIAFIQKRVARINASTPNPEHIHVGVQSGLYESAFAGLCAGWKEIGWNNVGAFRKKLLAIDGAFKCGAPLIGRTNPFDVSNAKTEGNVLLAIVPME